MRTITSLTGATLALALFAACGGTEPAAPEKPPEKHAEPEPAPEPAPEPVAAEPAAAPGAVMTIEQISAAREANREKVVKVSGVFMNATKQTTEQQINLSIQADASGEGAKILCITDYGQEAAVDALAAKSEVTVMGTVSKKDFFDSVKLEDCKLEASAAAPANEAGEKKAGGGGAKKRPADGKKRKGKKMKRKKQ